MTIRVCCKEVEFFLPIASHHFWNFTDLKEVFLDIHTAVVQFKIPSASIRANSPSIIAVTS